MQLCWQDDSAACVTSVTSLGMQMLKVLLLWWLTFCVQLRTHASNPLNKAAWWAEWSVSSFEWLCSVWMRYCKSLQVLCFCTQCCGQWTLSFICWYVHAEDNIELELSEVHCVYSDVPCADSHQNQEFASAHVLNLGLNNWGDPPVIVGNCDA